MDVDARDGGDRGPVVIVGGGLAGMAAAVGLTQHHVPSILLESRSRLGGRASSFPDTATGEWVDNCQHVAMGCCTNFRAWCETIGACEAFERQRELFFVDPRGRINRFRATNLPAPLHLFFAFARLSYLSIRDKLGLAFALRRLVRESPHDDRQSFADWLMKQRQSPRVIERFWTVVLVSALSESLDRISIPAARKVFLDGFLAHRDGWSVDIPTTPLEDMYESTVATWMTDHGVIIRRLTAADAVILDDAHARVAAVRLKGGEILPASDLILAVPPHRVDSLLPESLRHQWPWTRLAEIESAPISSLHFWFDRPIIPLPHAVFVSGLVQWVFARKSAPLASSAGHYYQVVISASREVLASDSATIQKRVLEELTQVWPEVSAARLLHARQVTEHRAVFSVKPGVEALRPPQQTAIANWQVAGDWTKTGWPGTMEGAVKSGFLAAENVLRRRGMTPRLVQPGLPRSWLVNTLLGLSVRD